MVTRRSVLSWERVDAPVQYGRQTGHALVWCVETHSTAIAHVAAFSKLINGGAGDGWGFVGLLDQLLERWDVDVFKLIDVEA